MTIEEVKKEYFRIAKLLNKEALTGDNYNLNCSAGYSTRFIKRELGLSYNGMKKIIGAKLASSANNNNPGVSSKKIYCGRNGGQMIKMNECLPGCNDACIPCKNKQINNIQAINTTNPERGKDYGGSFGNSGALAAAEGFYNN